MPTTRRTFTPEFKAEAVKLVTEQGRSFVEAARDLDIGESTLRSWRQAIAKGGAQAFPGRGNPPALPGGGPEAPPGRGQAAHDGARNPERSDGLLRRGVVMRYGFVEAHRDRWPIRLMCRVPRVSPGGYYDRRGRPRSPAGQRREAPVISIGGIHGEVKARHGGPRVHAELVARGTPCCVNTVARLMRAEAVAAKSKRESRRTTDSDHGHPVAEDIVNRRFEPGAVDETWSADITSIATGEGRLYLAAVEGLHSRRIVGRSMGSRIDSRPVVDALEMAVARRRPGATPIAHSDRGSRYAGEPYRGLLAGQGITCGMSRRGNCWDNAPMEPFFASLKRELTHGEDYATREEARASIFESIEIFFNRIRRHSSLGYLSPAEYERAG